MHQDPKNEVIEKESQDSTCPKEAAPPRSPSCTSAYALPLLQPLLQKEQQWKGYQSILTDVTSSRPSPTTHFTQEQTEPLR